MSMGNDQPSEVIVKDIQAARDAHQASSLPENNEESSPI